MKWKLYKPRPLYDADTGGGSSAGSAANKPDAPPSSGSSVNDASNPAKSVASGSEPFAGSGSSTGNEPSTGSKPDTGHPPAKTYTQADFDALRTELEQIHAANLSAAVEEVAKTAKMTQTEKDAYEQKKRLELLDQREKDIALRELRTETAQLLAAKDLPAGVLDMVIGADKVSTEKNIEAFKTAFDAAVQAQVETRLAGKTPQAGQGTASAADDVRAQFKNAINGF